MKNKEEFQNTISKSISKSTSLILCSLENIYPKDEKLNLARKSILSALGEKGLQFELSRIVDYYYFSERK